jgi:hypothetical protein
VVDFRKAPIFEIEAAPVRILIVKIGIRDGALVLECPAENLRRLTEIRVQIDSGCFRTIVDITKLALGSITVVRTAASQNNSLDFEIARTKRVRRCLSRRMAFKKPRIPNIRPT